MNKLIIWGASGHGKVVLDVARAQGGFTSVVFIDDAFGSCLGDFKVAVLPAPGLNLPVSEPLATRILSLLSAATLRGRSVSRQPAE